MSTTALVVEFLITGLILLLASIFGILIIFGVYDISALENIKDYITIIAVFLLVFSYILGISIHRVSFTIFRLINKFLLKIAKPKSSSPCIDDSSWNKKHITIRQSASDNLVKYIDYELSLARILNTSAFIYPLLILTSSIWLSNAYNFRVSLIITLINIGIYLIIISATFIQRTVYEELMSNSYDFLKEEKEQV